MQALHEVVDLLIGHTSIAPTRANLQEIFRQEKNYAEDFNEVKGQEPLKRALEIAAGRRVLSLYIYGRPFFLVTKGVPKSPGILCI